MVTYSLQQVDDLLATAISVVHSEVAGGDRKVTGRLQGETGRSQAGCRGRQEGHRQVADVARRSQGRFGCKELLLAASETSLQPNRL